MSGDNTPSFDPRPHLTKIPRKQRQPDGSWKQIENDYLPVAPRLIWFRAHHPEGEIFTDVEVKDDAAIAKARVVVNGKTLGSGSGYCTLQMWQRYPEKAETTAIGRALAAAGFGTQFCGDEFDEGEDIVDSPIDLPKARNPAGGAAATSSTTAAPARAAAPNGASSGPKPAATTGSAASRAPAPSQSGGASGGFTDRPATEPQIKAIYAIGRATQAMSEDELEETCRGRYGCRVGELNRRQASEFIDALKLGAV